MWPSSSFVLKLPGNWSCRRGDLTQHSQLHLFIKMAQVSSSHLTSFGSRYCAFSPKWRQRVSDYYECLTDWGKGKITEKSNVIIRIANMSWGKRNTQTKRLYQWKLEDQQYFTLHNLNMLLSFPLQDCDYLEHEGSCSISTLMFFKLFFFLLQSC